MSHRCSLGVLLVGLALLLSGLGSAPALAGPGLLLPDQTAQAAPGLQVLNSGERGAVLELLTPAFELLDGEAEGRPCQTLVVEAYGSAGQPGRPDLPVRAALLGVPPGADLHLEVLEADVALLAGRYDLCPVPGPVVEAGPDGSPAYRGLEFVPDPQIYGVDAFYPGAVAEVVPAGQIRSQHVAQVRLYPFRYNPVSGQVLHARRLRVRVDWSPAAAGVTGANTLVEAASFDQLLQNILLNGDLARRWQVPPAPRTLPAAAPLTLAAQAAPALKILVDETGIYQINPADLAAAGVDPAGLDPRTLRLQNGGQELAIHVAGEADGSFDPDDYLLFYGEGVDTPYTEVNVYWLTWGGSPGQRMMDRDGTPTGSGTISGSFTHSVHAEEDHIYNSKVPPGEDKDHWFWNSIFANGAPAARDYALLTGEVATEPISVTVRGLLVGFEDFGAVSPDHHTQVYLNGHLVHDATWDGAVEYPFEVQVAHGYLVEGDNVLNVTLPCDLGLSRDVVYANWFEIDYPRTYTVTADELPFANDEAGLWEYHLPGFASAAVEVFDVTDPAAVSRIVGGSFVAGTLAFEDTVDAGTRYLALGTDCHLSPLEILVDTPSELRSTANGADYLIITHGDFYTDVLPLESHRAAQGLRTMVADVQDVYDEFSGGVFDPEAIRSFLAYAYDNWIPPAPAYVLLVGDGSLDFKDNLGTGDPNLIPPYLADVDPWIHETATDNRYVCISGDDAFPDMHIGRLPVRTPAESAAAVQKILDYETAPPPGDWNQKVLFVADNEDQDGDFAWLSDQIADEYVPDPYLVDKVYYQVTHPDLATTRAALFDAINGGRLLVNYIGHASYQWWAHEQLFRVSDIDNLSNGGRLPFMVPMTCYEGFFHAPGIPSLGESLVRAAGKGAIASWSPTGLGVALGHDYLNCGLYEAIFSDDVIEIGPATTLGKLYLYTYSPSFWDLLDTYLLFGDPALRLNVLPAEVGLEKAVSPTTPLLPTDPLTYTLSVTNLGPATAHHVVITDLLPAFVTATHVVSTNLLLEQRPGAPFAWDVQDLAAGQSGTIVLRGAIDGAAGVGAFENQARIATSAREAGSLPNQAAVSSLVVAGPPATVGLDAAPPQIWIGGPGSRITARVDDAWGNPVADGIPVSFTTSLGVVAPAASTTSGGQASTLLTSAEAAGTATVTATVDGLQGSVQVTILPVPAARIWLPVVFRIGP